MAEPSLTLCQENSANWSRSLGRKQPESWTNAYNTIKGIYEGPGNLSGICYEPGFIDSDNHRALWYADGLVRVGESLAAGILDYLEM